MDADCVVLCPGMWTRELAAMVGVNVPLHACEHYYALFESVEALLRDREAGPAKRLLQFRLLDPQPLLYHNEPIWHEDSLVGYVTSGAYGHTLGGAIGLGYVDTAKAPESGFSIEVAGDRIPAEVSSRPMYDPGNRRIRR